MNYAKRKKNLRFYGLLYANYKEKNCLGGMNWWIIIKLPDSYKYILAVCEKLLDSDLELCKLWFNFVLSVLATIQHREFVSGLKYVQSN